MKVKHRTPRRKPASLVALFVATLLGLLFIATGIASATSGSTVPQNKVDVCKYVGTPGVDERLQTGQNPIEVSVNAIKTQHDPPQVGDTFADKHTHSLVVAVAGDPEPTIVDCPGYVAPSPSDTPTTEPPTSGSSSVTETPPASTSEAPSTSETETAPSSSEAPSTSPPTSASTTLLTSPGQPPPPTSSLGIGTPLTLASTGISAGVQILIGLALLLLGAILTFGPGVRRRISTSHQH